MKSAKYKRKYLLSIISICCFICFSHNVSACLCKQASLETLNDIEKYQFIALVKVDSIFFQREDTLNGSLKHTVSISIKELYRGDPVSQIKVSGGNFGIKPDKVSSCDMGISKGEEWIIFASALDGNKLHTGRCTFSIRYKSKSGERDWMGESGFNRIHKIKEILGIQTELIEILNGTIIEKYPNGNIENESNYINGKLEGERTIFYSTGLPMIEEYYENGQRNGKSIWYYQNGNIRRHYNFKNDIQIYSCLDFWDNNQLASLQFYTSSGIDLFGNTFSQNGSKSSEYLMDTVSKIRIHKRYFESGEIECETISKPNSTFRTNFFKNGNIQSTNLEYQKGNIASENKTWNENGELLYHVQFDRERKKNIIYDKRRN